MKRPEAVAAFGRGAKVPLRGKVRKCEGAKNVEVIGEECSNFPVLGSRFPVIIPHHQPRGELLVWPAGGEP